MKKKYFTMFSVLMFGYPEKPAHKAKIVAKCESDGQAKYLAGLLNTGLLSRSMRISF